MQIYSTRPSFGRRLTPFEKIENRILIQEGKKAVGLDNMLLVTHSVSLPSNLSEDTGLGILSKNTGAVGYIDMAYDNGFNGVLLEPSGSVKAPYYSPYEASLMSKKEVCDLKALTTDKWGNILPKEEFDQITKNREYKTKFQKQGIVEDVYFEKNRAIYDYAMPAHKKALRLAYSNFIEKLEEKDPKIVEINEKFENYKKENAFYLEKDAVYTILSEKHGNDDYSQWPNDFHKNLFNNSSKYSQEERTDEYENIKAKNKNTVESYMFSQFVIDTQQREFADYAANISKIKLNDDLRTLDEALKTGEITPEKAEYLKTKLLENTTANRGVKLIGDKPVGFSSMDVWANKDLFTTDEYLGAPPNPMKKRGGQDWNFAFIPHEKLFNEDKTLAEGGEYMKQVFKKMLKDNPGGLRIDHILGLIDPWTYQKTDEQNVRFSDNGSRYIFKQLLKTDLKELQELGFNEASIKGILDPVGVINGANTPKENWDSTLKKNVEILNERGITDFETAKNILDSKKDKIINDYSQIIDTILLPACEEVVIDQSKRNGESLTKTEITQKAYNMLICEDLGTYTAPLKMVMDKTGLKGMRHAAYSDPENSNQKYREGNKAEQGHYWLVGTHDDAAYINKIQEKDFNKEKHANYISEELGLDKSSLENDSALVRAKIARLISADKNPKTPNNVILNWLDWLGETKRYNTPGLESKKENWTLRVAEPGENFEKRQYAQILPSGEGINIDEALTVSMDACGVTEDNIELYNGLQKYAKIVEEKE